MLFFNWYLQIVRKKLKFLKGEDFYFFLLANVVSEKEILKFTFHKSRIDIWF